MKPVTLRAKGNSDLSEREVHGYLRAHPDFFERNEELLELLMVPHRSGAAVSLVERQLSLYRKNNERLERELEHLVEIARENELLFQKMHKLTLALMEANDPETMIRSMDSIWRREFKADFVALRLFHAHDTLLADGPLSANQDRILESFQSILETRLPECGSPVAEQVQLLFAADADRIRSIAIVPFYSGHVTGLLAIGSTDEQRFAPGMGNLFLSRIGEMLGSRVASIFAN